MLSGIILGLVVGFVIGILVGRKNKALVETSVEKAKTEIAKH